MGVAVTAQVTARGANTVCGGNREGSDMTTASYEQAIASTRSVLAGIGEQYV